MTEAGSGGHLPCLRAAQHLLGNHLTCRGFLTWWTCLPRAEVGTCFPKLSCDEAAALWLSLYSWISTEAAGRREPRERAGVRWDHRWAAGGVGSSLCRGWPWQALWGPVASITGVSSIQNPSWAVWEPQNVGSLRVLGGCCFLRKVVGPSSPLYR